MGVRLLEGGIAAAFGAGDALITSKVARMGPGGIPWPVYYEGAGIAALFFGRKVGIPAEVNDMVGISALALAGARLTRTALTGKLMSGPKAWGGDVSVGGVGDYSSYVDPSLAAAAAGTGGVAPAGIRTLPGRGGGWSLTGAPVPMAEAAGAVG